MTIGNKVVPKLIQRVGTQKGGFENASNQKYRLFRKGVVHFTLETTRTTETTRTMR